MNIREEMKVKVLRASNTNGVKQKILKVVEEDCGKRSFNRCETLNAINAIGRTKFFTRMGTMEPQERAFKYSSYRAVEATFDDDMNNLEYIHGELILTI